MATYARKFITKPDEVSRYHLTARCVRRAYLCGKDIATGSNFEHRRLWLEKRLELIFSDCFFVELISYAIMNNHFHLVVRIRPDLATDAHDNDIVDRWWKLFPRKIKGKYQEKPPEFLRKMWLENSEGMLSKRRRLASISQMMASITEYIARRANREDQVTGRFWEGRFKSQILLDEKATLAAATYVDLNPIRAGMADSLENSSFTSIKKRIEGLGCKHFTCPSFLTEFSRHYRVIRRESPCLAIDPKDYVAICALKAAKTLGVKGSDLKKAVLRLERLLLTEADLDFGHARIKKFRFAVGTVFAMQEFARRRGVQNPWHCREAAKPLFGSKPKSKNLF